MKRLVTPKQKISTIKTLSGELVERRTTIPNLIRILTRTGRYTTVDSNNVECYQVLDINNAVCNDSGFGVGDQPCHDVYMSVKDYDYVESQGITGSVKANFREIIDDHAFLSKTQIKDVIAQQTYATQIIGMTYLNTKTETSHAVPTNYSLLDNKMRVEFTAPSSGNVLIELSFFRDSIGSNATIYGTMGDANGSAYSGFEKKLHKADEIDDVIVKHEWVLSELDSGEAYVYTILLKSDDSRMSIKYGGEYPAFIVKATVLPETLLT